MLRFEVSEAGQGTLPAIDIADNPVMIGSGAAARLRLPAGAAREQHVRLDDGKWIAIGDVIVDGKPHVAGDAGPLGSSTVFELGTYRVRVGRAPAGAPPSTPQRTESIARELVRAMLGAGAAPTFAIEQGPDPGSTRALPPPEATIVIGRGDESDWVILDQDLSRAHAEVRRGWDGVSIKDRGSKNGTRVDGVACATDTATELRDGAVVTMGKVTLRFRDPAEAHLVGEPPTIEPPLPPVVRDEPTRAPVVAADAGPPPETWPFVVAVAIAALATLGFVYVLVA